MSAPCPAGHTWCEHDLSGCDDEHTEIGTYIPATGSAPTEVFVEGVYLPTIAAFIRTDEGNPVPYLVVHHSGRRHDVETCLQLHEAEALAAQLAERCAIVRDLITGGGAA